MLQNLLPIFLAAAPAAVPAFQDPAAGAEEMDPADLVEEQDDEYLLLKFDETEEGGLSVKDFITICQQNTDLNFTLHEQATAQATLLEKKILLYGEKRIKKKDFYSFFQTMMKINGFVCVPQGSDELEVIMITPVNASTTPQVKAGAIFVPVEDVDRYADQPGVWVATVVPLTYAQAQGLGTSLRTALGGGPTGQDAFMPLPTENALLIQNFGPFVAAAVRLVQRLDVKPEIPRPVFAKITLQYASAEELSELIKDLLDDSSGPGGGRAVQRGRQQGDVVLPEEEIETRIIPYPRDNSLIVTASEDSMERVKDLVAQLDSRITSPETKYRVYQLKNIPARELAQDLADYLQRTQQAEEQAMRGTGQAGAQARQAEQRVVVVGQEETNSLLITATRTRWAELEALLDQLDERQPQVLIETALIEVSEDFARDLGFEYASVTEPNPGTSTGFGFTSVGLSTLVDTNGDGVVDTRVPNANMTGMTAGILDGDDFGIPVLLAASQTDTDANVLSIPSVLVTNNRRAVVEAADEIPTTEQTPVQNVGITTTFAGYEEAGIKLEITPSISSNRYLRIDLFLEVSTFRGAFTGGTIPPPKITRTITTTVYLPDGSTMWVGGIIRDDLTVEETGIPFLSDLPLVGFLFGRTQDNAAKSTLYFFCTPRILDDFEELADISAEGKSQAAEVIGLDRLQRIDPSFRFEDPMDVILDQDLDGDGEFETGMLDLSAFSQPSFVAEGGFLDPREVGVDPSQPRGEVLIGGPAGIAVPERSIEEVRASEQKQQKEKPRNLPEDNR